MKAFDVFISYKSEDEEWAQRIRRALQERGVLVWLDKDQIRPGDRFITALEGGLETSRAVTLLATKESLESGWVTDEYHRALTLSQQGQLQLIPVLLRDAPLPGFLTSRQRIDLREDALFEQAMDRLVWPGITGKRVLWYPISGGYLSPRWQRIVDIAQAEGVTFSPGGDLHRSDWFIRSHIQKKSQRLVVVVDPFEGRSADPALPRSRVVEYTNFIMQLRAMTKGQSNEIVFVLYQQLGAWQQVDETVDVPWAVVQRLSHYFSLSQDEPNDEVLRSQFRTVWTKVQRDLMISERGGRAA